MTLFILIAAQRNPCLIKTEFYVYTPDYHKSVTGLLEDMNTQIGALTDPSLFF